MKLQDFAHRASEYLRPNQDWVCGRLKDGSPCQMGPDRKGRCIADYECRPIKKGDRWNCTRSEGGTCKQGPSPQGICCRAIPRCRPTRSMRAKRQLFVRWFTAATIGFVALLGSLKSPTWFVDPGPLSTNHAEISNCSECHESANVSAHEWLGLAIGTKPTNDVSNCTNCHDMGPHDVLPHGVSVGELTLLKRQALESSDTWSGMPLSAGFLMEYANNAESPIACASCHSEHRGSDFDPARMSNSQCVVCHEARFTGFADGHPEFHEYPYQRRSRILFDHTSHFGKHFDNDSKEAMGQAPNCLTCHVVDARGEEMLTNSFELTCAGCHGDQVTGENRTDSRGIAVFVVPGIDIDTLAQRGFAVGEWPEYSEENLSSFMDLLLTDVPAYKDSREKLRELDLLDLSDATNLQLADVERFVWQVKEFFYGLRNGGTGFLIETLERTLDIELTNSDKSDLIAQLPFASLIEAQEFWFPNLSEEIRLHRAGVRVLDPTKQTIEAATNLPDIERGQDAKSAHSSEEINFGDLDAGEIDFGDLDAGEIDFGDLDEGEIDFGDLDEGEIDFGDLEEGEIDFESDSIAAETKSISPLTGDQWIKTGGWFREEFVLRYKPRGHADSFLTRWFDVSGYSPNKVADRIFNALAGKNSLGSCSKCHSSDKGIEDERVYPNWHSESGSQPHHQEFTRYKHASHFSLLGDDGCLRCHQVSPDVDFSVNFSGYDPSTYVSNFSFMKTELCSSCHVPEQAGDDCLTCHNYHVGELPPASVAKSSLSWQVPDNTSDALKD